MNMQRGSQLGGPSDLAILSGSTLPQKRTSPFLSSDGKRQKQTKSYRVRGVPLEWTEAQLQGFLAKHDGFTGPVIKSLARETHGRSKTATITLNTPPPNDKSWSIELLASPERQLTFDDDFFGLTTLYAPPTGHEVDIIAISGLGGHAFGSFKQKDGEHMWLRDSLPRDLVINGLQQPIARVLIYGYESKIPDSENTQNLDDLASTFRSRLVSLVHGPAIKPIILIAHSLGGLIVKQTLISLSKSTTGDDSILDQAVCGIVFFGVPQAGMDVSSLLPMAKEGPNRYLIDSINQGSRRQREEFYDYLERRRLEVFCFYETLLSPTAIQDENGKWTRRGQKQLLVNQTSATDCHRKGTASTHVCAISCTHSDMVKFTPHDHNYDAVRDRLIALAGRAGTQHQFQEHSGPRHTHPTRDESQLSRDQRRHLVELLQFDQADARIKTVKKPTGSTCSWIYETPEYRRWSDPTKLVEHHGFWWIRGKPGAGKSVLMRYLFDKSHTTIHDAKIIYFFFNARGDVLERTTLGLYRSLLFQIFKLIPNLQDTLDTLGTHTTRAIEQDGWQIPGLQDVLLEIVQRLKSLRLVCYIDALDECPEYEIRDMVQFFEEVGKIAVSNETQLFICFSSRHYPNITIERGLNMILQHQQNHELDIKQFIDTKLKMHHSTYAEEVKQDILEKASGVFLWVVLVIPMLNRELDHGKMNAFKQRLRELPRKLSELFRDILTRDAEDKDALLCCIQWVLFARSPLDITTLYFAIDAATDDDTFQWNQEETTPKIIERYILSASKGLVEQTMSKVPTMQFIHESVRDFLLRERGFQKLWPELGSHFEAKSHQLLAQYCLKQIKSDSLKGATVPVHLPKASSENGKLSRSQLTSSFPFLEYAVNNILYHCNEAQAFGEQQTRFVDAFPKTEWIHYHNLLAKFDTRRYTSDISLLYILAELDLAQLIRLLPDRTHHLDLEEGRYGKPLLAALACGNRNAARDLGLQVFLDQGVPIHVNKKTESYFASLKPNREFSYKKKDLQACLAHFKCFPTLNALILQGTGSRYEHANGQKFLLSAAEHGITETVELLLRRGVNIEATDKDGRTPLLAAAAAEQGITETVELLLRRGVNIEATDKDGRTPLLAAAAAAAADVVEQLIDKGANIEATDKDGRTPLLAAAEGHRKSTVHVVKQLLNKGANIEATDKYGRTPLAAAAAAAAVLADVVIQLLNKGANIEVTDKHSRTPLAAAVAAAVAAAADVVEQLIDKGANIEATDKYGRTPLLAAAAAKTAAGAAAAADIVKQLLDKGANIEVTDEYGRTPLLVAAAAAAAAKTAAGAAAADVVKQLLDKGANIEATDKGGRTPLLVVLRAKYTSVAVDIIKQLLNKGANIEAMDKGGRTPLFLAKAEAAAEAKALGGRVGNYPAAAVVKLLQTHQAAGWHL